MKRFVFSIMALGVMIACNDNANPTSPSAGNFPDTGVQSNTAGGNFTPIPVNDNTPKPGSPPPPLIDPSDPNHNGAHYVDIIGPGGCLEGLEHEWTVTVHEPNHRLRTASFHDEVASCEPTTRRAGGHFEVIEVANPGDTIFKWHGNLSCGRYQADIAVADERTEEFTTIVGIVINTGVDCEPEEIIPPVEPPVIPPIQCLTDDCPEPPVCEDCEPPIDPWTPTNPPNPSCEQVTLGFSSEQLNGDPESIVDWINDDARCPRCRNLPNLENPNSPVLSFTAAYDYAIVVLWHVTEGEFTLHYDVSANDVLSTLDGDAFSRVEYLSYCTPAIPTNPLACVPTEAEDYFVTELPGNGSNPSAEEEEIQQYCPLCFYDGHKDDGLSGLTWTFDDDYASVVIKYDGYWDILFNVMNGYMYTVPIQNGKQHEISHITYFVCP